LVEAVHHIATELGCRHWDGGAENFGDLSENRILRQLVGHPVDEAHRSSAVAIELLLDLV
jgi:hypothetical protein